MRPPISPDILPPDDFDLGLVASDIDGTLLLNWKPISTATIDAIHRCQDAGIPFVLVTGRPIRWLAPIAEQIPDLGRVVCLNGAVVYDIASQSVVDAHTIDAQTLTEITAAVRVDHPEARFAYETLNGGFIDREFVTGRPREARIIDDVSELAGEDVVKVLVRLETSDSQAMHDLIDPLVDGTCHASFSEPDNGLVELAPYGITKAKTLSDLCDHLGVARAQVMAFGDMPNDIEMLSWAGHGVAMGNALGSVKAIAAAVTEAVDDDGVARYLDAVLDTRPN
ncbi:haloacid dehalogenase [Brevibacterium sediminis]|uniref:Haloacid dehalogenase n=1 Tax=Brevibacterium sediminis TaxID=1857024 RepID=A0ABQ1LT73_9MICO|nr:HAD family hydrolase [Brevibacterium sediminis]GGC28569.1 haloacid dehalogenase [Brevibacterium sediminis]